MPTIQSSGFLMYIHMKTVYLKIDDSIFRATSAYGVDLNVSDNQHDSGKNRTSNKIRNFQ